MEARESPAREREVTAAGHTRSYQRARRRSYSERGIASGSGSFWEDAHAPFDAILVSAGGPEVPPTLKAQLRIGGRLVIPIGEPAYGQELVRVTRTNETEFSTETLLGVHFVPLIGAEGFHAAVS